MEIKDVRVIEIELFSFCNRRCMWCPNRDIDRISNIQYLDQNILISLIDELAAHGYSNYISFSRYNEPMSHPEILKAQTYYIKSRLPQATLVTNTNGDYLTEKNLRGLYIDELTVMDYDNCGIPYGLEKLKQLNCTNIKVEYPYIYAQYDNIKILYYISWPINSASKITDRGGSLPQYSREIRLRPCYEPMYFIGINYDGTVSPCCNIRNDIEYHQDYVFGNLNYNTSLEEILKDDHYTHFIKVCESAQYEAGSPCYYCQNSGGRYTRDEGSINYV